MQYLQVTDIRDARIVEVLDSISTTHIIYLPPVSALTPTEFFQTNIDFQNSAGKELESKSNTAEEAVMELIGKFLVTIDELEEDQRNEWLDPEKATKPFDSREQTNAISEDAGNRQEFKITQRR